MTLAPAPTVRSNRAAQIIAAARRILEDEGLDALTMRRLATDVGMQAPSLYKHFATKRAVEGALIEQGLIVFGKALHAAVVSSGDEGPVRSLLAAYRETALANPVIYLLSTSSPLPREDIAPGVEEWAGEPFFDAIGDPWRAQAMFSFAHGMVVLELNDRFLEGSDLDRTWGAGADAFAR